MSDLEHSAPTELVRGSMLVCDAVYSVFSKVALDVFPASGKASLRTDLHLLLSLLKGNSLTGHSPFLHLSQASSAALVVTNAPGWWHSLGILEAPLQSLEHV